ncbi:MAG: hypothetical protein JWO37_947 [Acidimicrobiales bacterium]|jgi:hypothetical protein|nr:hypothetical protein [Acidimicrobiales bacterium]
MRTAGPTKAAGGNVREVGLTVSGTDAGRQRESANLLGSTRLRLDELQQVRLRRSLTADELFEYDALCRLEAHLLASRRAPADEGHRITGT